MKQDILFDISTSLFRSVLLSCEIVTGIVADTAVLKGQGQIFEKQPFQINPGNRKNTLRSLQNRRGKHLSHGNVNICHTVFKNGFPGRIVQLPKIYGQIRRVAASSGHMKPVRPVQRRNQDTLNPLIRFIVQRVNPENRIENILIGCSLWIPLLNGRKRERNDGKAPVLPDHRIVVITACNLAEAGNQLLLSLVKRSLGRSADRGKRCLAEHLHHSGSRIENRFFLPSAVSCGKCLHSSSRKIIVQKER